MPRLSLDLLDFSRETNPLERIGGAEGNRTPDLIIANDALYQLSYGPKEGAE